MKLSNFQNSSREGLHSHGYEIKPCYQLPQIETPVEPVGKLCEISQEMFLTDCMKCLSQRVLHIADNGDEPLELSDLYIVRASTNDDRNMVIPSSANFFEAAKTICNNIRSGSYMLVSPGFNSFYYSGV